MLELLGEMSSRAWNVVFERGFNDWEMTQVMSFFSVIQSHLPRSLDADRLIWTLNGKGCFDARSFYHALCTPPMVPFPRRLRRLEGSFSSFGQWLGVGSLPVII